MPVEPAAALTGLSQLVIAVAALGVPATVYAAYRNKLENSEAVLTASTLVGAAVLAAVVMSLVAA